MLSVPRMMRLKAHAGVVCPHVSFQNPSAPEDAPPRQSVETRSIVITKEDDQIYN